MKVRKKVVKTYHCDVCNTGYQSAKKARECDKRPVEVLVAGIGDSVRITEKRTCWKNSGKPYVAEGVITEITPPQPCDEEYELKWLGGNRLGTHVRQYLVHYKCPRCDEMRHHPVFAPEFTVLVSKKKVAKQTLAKSA